MHGQESNNHSLRGGEAETSLERRLAGDVTIDFDEYGLRAGDSVNNQYQKYGLSFSSSGGCGLRIFDSSHPTGGDYDLGSPNYSCHHPGPGVGHGGRKGERGENCNSLYNVLIIQECNGGKSGKTLFYSADLDLL